MLIYERIKTKQFLRFFKFYKSKLIFLGRLDVAGLLMIGRRGYWYLQGTQYGQRVYDGLMRLLDTAKIDDRALIVTDWQPDKGRLLIYVTKA